MLQSLQYDNNRQSRDNVDKNYLIKPRLRQSFMPLEIEGDESVNNVDKSVWAWLRTFVKPKGSKIQVQATYAKIKDKCYFGKTVGYQASFSKKTISFLDKHFNVYEPEHPVLLIWEFFVMLFLYLNFIQIPLAIFFWNYVFIAQFSTIWSLLFNYISIFLLTIDIFIRFNTAYYQHGLIVLKRESIIKRYLSWRFEVDFVCLIVLICYVFIDQNWVVYVKLIFYLKLYQASQYDQSIQSSLELNLLFISIYRLFRIVGIFVLYSHIMACGFFYLDYSLYLNNSYYYQAGLLWLTNSAALPVNMIETYDWYVWYEYAMYWALQTSTTVGYGDITPMNPQQVLYVIINMIFMCVIFGYFINSIWEIIGDWGDKSKRYKQNFSNLNRYLKNKNVSAGLEQKLRAYLDYLWRQDTIEDIQSTIVSKLTPGLRDQLMLNIKYPFFLKLRFFNTLQTKTNQNRFSILKKNLANDIKQQRYSQDQIVYNQASIDNRLFYIIQGKIQLRIRNFTTEILTTQNFGQYEFLTQRPHCANAIAIKYCSLYILEKSVFLEHLQQFPQIYQGYLQTRDRVLNNMDLSPTSVTCYFCFQEHLVTYCPKLTYVPNEDRQMQRRVSLQYSQDLDYGEWYQRFLDQNQDNFQQNVAEYEVYNPKFNITALSKHS